mgnify:CR=1 FL=1
MRGSHCVARCTWPMRTSHVAGSVRLPSSISCGRPRRRRRACTWPPAAMRTAAEVGRTRWRVTGGGVGQRMREEMVGLERQSYHSASAGEHCALISLASSGRG